MAPIFSQAFIPGESLDKANKYHIAISGEVYNTIPYIDGSYNIIMPRLFGLDYPSFLLYIKKNFNAILKGKNNRYVRVVFKNKQDCQAICDELSSRWNIFKQKYDNYLKENPIIEEED